MKTVGYVVSRVYAYECPSQVKKQISVKPTGSIAREKFGGIDEFKHFDLGHPADSQLRNPLTNVTKMFDLLPLVSEFNIE